MKTLAFAFRSILVAACVVLVGVGFDTSAEQPLRIEQNGTAHELRWGSENGTTSFLQHSPDLSNWQYTPHYHVGDGSARTQTLDEDLRPVGNDPLFYRLLLHPTNPEDPDDTDGDGLPNIFELGHGYVPVLTDSDGNGTPDGDEDLDDDGDSNATEISNGTDANDSSSNSGEDPDEDGLTNKEESAIGTDPDVADTDEDGIIDSEDGWPLCKELAPARLSKPKYAVIRMKELESNQVLRQFDINNNAHAIVKVGNNSHYYKADATGNPLIELPSSYLNSWGGTDYYVYKSLNQANYFVQGAGAIYQCGVLKAYLKPHDLPHDDNPDWGVRPSMQVDCVGPDGTSYGRGFSSKYPEPKFEWRTLTGPTSYISAVSWDANGEVSLQGDLAVKKGGSYNEFSWGFDSGYEFLGNYKIDHVSAINSVGLRMIDREKINGLGYSYGFDRYYGEVRYDLGVWRNSTFQSLLTDYAMFNNEYYNYENAGDELKASHLSNNNTVMAGLGSDTLIWLDQAAGLQNDQPVTAIPNLKKITWLETWGPAPPINLNARMQGFESNGSKIWHNSLWLDIADIIPATEWTDIQIKDINDHGMLAAQATDAAGIKCAVFLVPVDIVPDYNRDGKIDEEDRGKVTEENPWRWWINDDNDLTVEERSGNLKDVPKQDTSVRDCNDLKVDGIRDLIDFFPLHLDLKQALEVLPESDYKYVLKHEEEALKFYEYPACVIDGSSQGSEPNRHVKIVGVGRGLATKELKLASSTGSELSAAMLTQAKQGNGVVVIEGVKKTEKPLVLEILKKSDNSSAAKIEFPMHIVDVEDMYRHVNMRASGGNTTQKNEPSAYPDDLTNGKYVAYIHGFNVSGESARGSQSNIYKRLHHLGNKARFIGVFWDGNPDNPLGLQAPAPDYHAAVFNGLLGGLPLKNQLAFAESSGLTILAHSLGNSIAGNAIAEHGLDVSHYYIINGAIPLQAYDAAQTNNSSGHIGMERSMTEDDWKPYYDFGRGERLLAANWHELFAAEPNDNRNELTWKNLFGKPELLSVAYNFYSPRDEVVENANEDSEEFFTNIANAIWTWDFSRHAWVQQEIGKGGQSLIAHTAFADLNGGWEFNFGTETINNITYPQGYYKESLFTGSGIYRKYTPEEADAEISNNDLKTKPFYKPFPYLDLYDSDKGSAIAGETINRYKLLATGIPATSYAIAANAADPFLPDIIAGIPSRNFNMSSELKSAGGQSSWPVQYQDRPDDWLHSDFKDVALHFLHPMYQKMIDIAELDKN